MQFDLLRMRRVLSFCAASLFLHLPGAVLAAEWSFEPSISLREEYSDNIRFTSLPHPGVWHSRLSPTLRLSSKTEASEVSGLAQLSINRYAGDPQVENKNDKFLSLTTSLQSELNTWAMNGSYKQDSTSESETAKIGVVHQARTQRSAITLNPSLTHKFTERSSFKLDYNYQDVKYDPRINNLNDYTYQQVGGMLQYRLTERDQLSLTANYSITDYSPSTNQYPPFFTFILFGTPVNILGGGTDTVTYKSSTRGVQANVMHLFSETLRGNLSVGARRIDTDTTHTCNGVLGTVFSTTNIVSCSGSTLHPIVTFNTKTEGSGSSFSANLEKTFDTAKVSGFASRDTNPSGSGLVETDKYGVSLNKSFTENLTGTVDAIAYRTRYISLTNPGSRYYIFEPKLNWRFTELWTLDAGYRHARSDPDSVDNKPAAAYATTSNALYLNLTYNWQKMAVSR